MSAANLPDEREIYAGRVITVRLKHVRMASGRLALREIVEHVGGVAIVACDEAGQVLLVRQPRPAVGAHALLELPAGMIDPGEAPEHTARRELIEETGLFAERLVPLTRFYTSPGYSTELLHVFAAFDLRPAATSFDADEEIELVRMPLDLAISHVLTQEVSDAKTLTGLLAYRQLIRPA